MKHKIGYNRLGRKPAHRIAMTRNMLVSFFKYERIRTTKAKAIAVRRKAEKMITRSRLDSVHNRRVIGRDIKDKEILAKLFTDIGPRYLERPGGYTRILKLGPRSSDAAEMVILELVSESVPETGKKKKKKSTKAGKEKTATSKATEPVAASDTTSEDTSSANSPDGAQATADTPTEVDSAAPAEASDDTDSAAPAEASDDSNSDEKKS